jgi:hypothetical protein
MGRAALIRQMGGAKLDTVAMPIRKSLKTGPIFKLPGVREAPSLGI